MAKNKQKPKINKPKKVLILGSGALKIGEAGEFDYSGSQCLKALKEEGIKTVLVNPNIATIQTSEGMADTVYFLPVTPYFVEKIIKKERPDAILLGFGGQTALNCGLELDAQGILKKYNVKVLGTSIKAIRLTEDRKLFSEFLKSIDVKTPKSRTATNIEQASQVAQKLGYPIMVRSGFALGGLGSGVARNQEGLKLLAAKALAYSKQILVEEYLHGWKEIEYEVVRDSKDNCITVCNMENFDPMGIHTGESIVVAPSQTLTNHEYHKLRQISIHVIRSLGIVGECNIQFAFDPHSEDYRVIEVNARLSRSSALASKATGYPLAFIAAKLALGYSLSELDNSITKKTKACFEPALDYVVLKIPRWDMQKFREVDTKIGSEMKSVGEVMAIGRKFEEVLQKALRMLSIGVEGLACNALQFDDLEHELENPTDRRIFAIAQAFKEGMPVDAIYALSRIDKWFLYKIKHIVDMEHNLKMYSLSKELLLKAKQLGFSDNQIALLKGKSELEIRQQRKQLGVMPFVRQIDTLGAEYPASTNYLYMTYNSGQHDALPLKQKAAIVLGSGAYRIGSSVEFDWCCVNAVLTLQQLGYKTIMINYNPETVSTDYDICDKLYFEELSLERVLDIYEYEQPSGVIVSMGGQIPNNIALKLHNQNVKIFGTSPVNIDRAEDRHKFSQLMDTLHIEQPAWKEVTTVEDAKRFAETVGYPLLVRPSYVLSGSAMSVVFEEKRLIEYIKKAADISREHPVVITKFIENAKEIEIDAVANKGALAAYAITEHIENAGVHSGDATLVLPAQRLYAETARKILDYSSKIAQSLQITGPFNMQFLAIDNDVKIIECNLRASRSFPFVSKVMKRNFIDIATKTMLGKPIPPFKNGKLSYVGVKAPQFSFTRLKGADPVLGVEMSSTGEVGCLGKDLNEAFLKAILAVGFRLPKKTVLLSTGPLKTKLHLLEACTHFKELGFTLLATEGTHKFLKEHRIPATRVYWPLDKKQPNVMQFLESGSVDLVINIPKSSEKIELDNDYIIRRMAIDRNIPLLTNEQITRQFAHALATVKPEQLEIKSWQEY
ncbi:carbamoyl-phosphate synthase (glutamine-hydrolyzing) large subunit [Candidatus Woesearchaeota archaeon]|nr:carbamoyl-phosphate synthase (glutamine-hydrolyzing) large subunit [Candidatus Woesearchaeota archaeon]